MLIVQLSNINMGSLHFAFGHKWGEGVKSFHNKNLQYFHKKLGIIPLQINIYNTKQEFFLKYEVFYCI